MRDARQLKRAAQVDWPSLISVMRGAAERAEQPFAAAVRAEPLALQSAAGGDRSGTFAQHRTASLRILGG